MLNLAPTIATIEDLLKVDSDSSITYAALECRLAIERICYEHLKISHDYIAHDDLRKWQPRDIVRVLIRDVDPRAAETFTMSISASSIPEGSPEPTPEEYSAMEFVPIGTHVGFNPNTLGDLWNAPAKLALHVNLPRSASDSLAHYGNKEAIKKKVTEALTEIRRIGSGTLLSTGVGPEVSFECDCGSKNKRRSDLLIDHRIVSCINPNCLETYEFFESDMSFERRTYAITCRNCGEQREIPKKMVEKLPTDRQINFDCEGCGDKIYVAWRPMQTQRVQSGQK